MGGISKWVSEPTTKRILMYKMFADGADSAEIMTMVAPDLAVVCCARVESTAILLAFVVVGSHWAV